jgi:uncharacterized membrane protein YoaK (UPF0700 family)
MARPSLSNESILTTALLGLTVVTGIVDATSYLALGHVFTANMTGNVVLLGFAIASAQGLSLTRSGAALVAFLIGALVGGRLAKSMTRSPRRRWVGIAFGAEAALYAASMGAAVGQGSRALTEPAPLYGVIVLTGLAMGVRNATVRKLGVPDLTTTVLTLTLAGLAADSVLAGGSGVGWSRRTGSVACAIVGAAAGARLLSVSVALPLAVCAAVSGLCALWAFVGLRNETAEGRDAS